MKNALYLCLIPEHDVVRKVHTTHIIISEQSPCVDIRGAVCFVDAAFDVPPHTGQMVSHELAGEEPAILDDGWFCRVFLQSASHVGQETLVHIGVEVCMAQINPECFLRRHDGTQLFSSSPIATLLLRAFAYPSVNISSFGSAKSLTYGHLSTSET